MKEQYNFSLVQTKTLIVYLYTHTCTSPGFPSLVSSDFPKHLSEGASEKEREREIIIGSLWKFWCGRQACPVCSLFNRGSKERWALCVQINIVWEQAVCWGTLHNLTPHFHRPREKLSELQDAGYQRPSIHTHSCGQIQCSLLTKEIGLHARER